MNKDLKFKKHIAYTLDFDYLDEKVEFLLSEPDAETLKKSFSEIILFFSDKKLLEPVNSSFLGATYVKCEDIKYTVECKNHIARRVLSILLNLQDKKKPMHADWYLYDFDSCNEFPQEIHRFFLASDGKIILENAVISSSIMKNENDANILIDLNPVTVGDNSMPLWNNARSNEQALALWYYQKFYRESEKGQVLAIRESLSSSNSHTVLRHLLPNNLDLSSHLSSKQILLSRINKKLTWIVIALGVFLLKLFF